MNHMDSKILDKFRIRTTDGDVGKVTDFYFDEKLFHLRYFLVDTKTFPFSHTVLLSPKHIKKFDIDNNVIEVDISKKVLEGFPAFDAVQTVSEQYEEAYKDYFSWSYYWGRDPSSWMIAPNGGVVANDSGIKETIEQKERKEKLLKEAKENVLRSANELKTYSIKAIDQSFGHLESFMINVENLCIDYLIVDTINFLPAKKVALRPEWVQSISWRKKEVEFPFFKDYIKAAPPYKPEEFSEGFMERADNHFECSLKTIRETNEKIVSFNSKNNFSIKNERRKLKEVTDKEVAVGDIPSGLFVITVENDSTKENESFLASWVQQVSFDPLLISLCIKEGRPGIDEVLRGKTFCVNVVGAREAKYLNHYLSDKPNLKEPLKKISHKKLSGKGAMLDKAKSMMLCEAHKVYRPGDHYLVTAKVLDGKNINPHLKPKTYVRSSGANY